MTQGQNKRRDFWACSVSKQNCSPYLFHPRNVVNNLAKEYDRHFLRISLNFAEVVVFICFCYASKTLKGVRSFNRFCINRWTAAVAAAAEARNKGKTRLFS